MPPPKLEELLAIERDPAVPDVELTRTSRARRRFLRGEVVDPREIATELGGHLTLTAQIAMQLGEIGFDVERVPGPEGVCYRVTNPDFTPSAETFEAARERAAAKSAEARERKRAEAEAAAVERERARAAKADKRAAARATNATTAVDVPPGDDVAGRVNGIPPLPELGQPVVVYALALDDDGSITLGVRNGSRRWVATITGTVDT